MHKFNPFFYPIGSLTEYFQFVDPDDAQVVKHDLDSMQLKVLSPVEQDIIEDKPSSIEEALYAKTKPLERSYYPQLDRVFLSI